MSQAIQAFLAYPATPAVAGEIINSAVDSLRRHSFPGTLDLWADLDIAGRFIIDGILERIDSSNLVIADISQLNFNVTYEIGYAIGSRKRLVIVKHAALTQINSAIASLGIYDTLGYKEYKNAEDLEQIIRNTKDLNPIPIPGELNRTAPVYLNFAKYKSDQDSLIRTRVKKAHFQFRNFDPNETPRLSAPEAIRSVAQSYGICLHLIPSGQEDSTNHNLRAAFLAGIALGLERDLLLIQYGESPIPLDCRDAVTYCRTPGNIVDTIAEFSGRVMDAWQTRPVAAKEGDEPFLE